MRSNDAYVGLPYDIFLFTSLQELMASELDIEIGTYYHSVNSLHIYHRDIHQIFQSFGQANEAVRSSHLSESISHCSLERLCSIETAIRLGHELPSNLGWVPETETLKRYRERKALHSLPK
jgi:thymidylate synthase